MRSIDHKLVRIWRIGTTHDQDKLNAYSAVLSAEELARAEKLRIENQRNMYITSHAAMRMILAEHLQTKPTTVDIKQQEKGKPFIKHTAPLHFSLSHTRDIALFALSTEQPVGLDIEQIKPAKDIMGIARRFYGSDEFNWLNNLDEQEQLTAFYQTWCYKEAILKGTGQGIQGGLDKVMIKPQQLAKGGEIKHENNLWFFQPIHIKTGYKSAVAHSQSRFEVDLATWEPS